MKPSYLGSFMDHTERKEAKNFYARFLDLDFQWNLLKFLASFWVSPAQELNGYHFTS